MSFITVVLPVFNRAEVVSRAIASVLSQTFSDFELIVVDDGSFDETPRLLSRFVDPRIVVMRIPTNGGACAARNLGIEAARGEIVCFLDSDDVYLPQKLERVVDRFTARPSLDLLVDSFVSRKTKGDREHVKSKRNLPGLTGPAFREAVFDRRVAKATTALSIRKRALLEVGGFDPALRRRQDLDLVLRLSNKHVCMTTDEVLWEKHDSVDAISRDHGVFLQASIDICDRHPDYLEFHSAAFYRDLRSHFGWLAKHLHWDVFIRDARLYAAAGRFGPSLVRLLFDRRVTRPVQRDSIQRRRADSGRPSKIAETSCAPARVE